MRHSRINIASVLICVAVGLASCSDSKEELDEKFTQTSHIVCGKVEKGPLVRGSQVDMRTLDKDLVPTGSSYTTTIENNTGDFNFGSLKVNSPYAKLTADGYFFNEVKGELSGSTIKLDAIVDLSDNSTVNVNVLTHLKSQRINYLVTNKKQGFKEANEQAQKELLTQFGLQQYCGKDASQFSITSGDDASGVLIAVSSLILSVRSEAEIVEYLSLLSNEFRTTGVFSESTKQKLKSTRNYLNGRLDEVSDHIKVRYSEMGYDVEVKDLAYYFDWDNDGIAGNELDDSPTVKLSQDKISIPSEGGDYEVKIDSDKPYFLIPPSEVTGSDTGLDVTPGGSITEENFFSSLYESGAENSVANIKSESTIDKNLIKIHVEPAKFRGTKSMSLMIYNARGAVSAQIDIEQKGNPNIQIQVPKLGSDGVSIVSATLATIRDAIKIDRSLEGEYVLSEQKTPFSPQNNSINNCWSKYYAALNYLMNIKNVDANALNCYQPYLNTYIALVYYQLTSHWGGVPYFVEKRNDGEFSISRTEEDRVLDGLSTLLETAITDLEEKKNDAFSDVNSAFFVSKDVARVLLAYTYCNQQKYTQALPLLEKVISNGYYSLVESNVIEFVNNSECILGFLVETRSGESCHPCLDYKDVILTAAECEYHNGNITKAKEYIEQICKAKSITIDETDPQEVIATIRKTFKSTNYLGFIRRNNLGENSLGLKKSQLYQLLWPIPTNELMYNPSMTQNPGY